MLCAGFGMEARLPFGALRSRTCRPGIRQETISVADAGDTNGSVRVCIGVARQSEQIFTSALAGLDPDGTVCESEEFRATRTTFGIVTPGADEGIPVENDGRRGARTVDQRTLNATRHSARADAATSTVARGHYRPPNSSSSTRWIASPIAFCLAGSSRIARLTWLSPISSNTRYGALLTFSSRL